jgi:hypothetical protein
MGIEYDRSEIRENLACDIVILLDEFRKLNYEGAQDKLLDLKITLGKDCKGLKSKLDNVRELIEKSKHCTYRINGYQHNLYELEQILGDIQDHFSSDSRDIA